MLLGKKFKKTVIGGIGIFYLWLIFTATAVELPSSDSPLLFYSNQHEQDLKATLCSALKKAQRSIFMHMYALTDSDVLGLIQHKQQQGLSTTVFYDPSASSDLKKKIRAYPVDTDGLMHRKIVIIDEAQVFLGSANLTTSSLTMHDNLILGFYHPELAQFLKTCRDSSFSFLIGTQTGEAWLLPDSEERALRQLLKTLQGAKKTIHVAMFTLTHPVLIQALLEAKQRGVEVSVAMDYYTALGASKRAFQAFVKEGIAVHLSRGPKLLHHKWACIDKTTLIIGSTNWTKAAFARNQDCFMILYPLTQKQQKFIEKVWTRINLEANTP